MGNNIGAEIGLYPFEHNEHGQIIASGWQSCNLVELNMKAMKSEEEFYDACRAAATLGTLQAGYTSFPYLGEVTERIVRREALLGVSMTGIYNCTFLSPSVMERGAAIVKEQNKKIAAAIGINQAARLCCTKPSGNASVLLGSASGIHPEYAPRYFRLMQQNKQTPIAQYLRMIHPAMVEDSVWSSTGADDVLFFAIEDSGSVYRKDVDAASFIARVIQVKQHWVDAGKNPELCVSKGISHNVSNTITVKPEEWDDVFTIIYEQSHILSGVSFAPESGMYDQAPFTEVKTAEQIFETYGDAAFFASGLIVDGMHVYGRLYNAIYDMRGNTDDPNKLALQKDWQRRLHMFATRYMNGDRKKTIALLYDVYLLHKWNAVTRDADSVSLEYIRQLYLEQLTDADTLSGAACFAGNCEIL